MAFAIHTAFAAISMAGRIIDIQSGFAIGTIYDPLSRKPNPVITSAFGMMAVAFFLAVDGHHAVVRGLAFSATQWPAGTALSVELAEPLVRQFGMVFTLGLALASPIVVTLFLVELGTGVLSRNLPQMNVFALGIPVKIVVTLAMLAAIFPFLGPIMQKIYASIFEYWEMVFR